MKRVLSLCSILFFLLFSATTSATTLDFEDAGTNVYGYIPDGYGSFHWDNFGYVSATIGGYGIEGDYSAFNGWGEDASLSHTSDDPFDFHSALFKGAWNNGLNILISGYSDGVSVFQEIITVDTIYPFLFSPDDWDNLDSLSFHSWGGTNAGLGGSGTHFAMDNFSFSPSPVPEPATNILVGLGLLGLGLCLKIYEKRKKECD